MQPAPQKTQHPDKAYEPVLMLMRARMLHQAGDLDEARSCYKKVLKKAPDNFQALHFYAQAEFAAGHVESGIRHLKRALLADPRSAQAQSDMAGMMTSVGRLEEALTACDKAIALDLTLVQAHHNRGHVLLQLGRLEEAIASFESALALDPTRADTWNDHGIALQKLTRFDKAIESFGKAIEVDPLHDMAFMNRAAVYKELKRLDEALADYDRAISIGKRQVEAGISRVEILLAKKDVQEALRTCTEVLKIEPKSARALTTLGNCMALLGDADTATALYDRALEVSPNYEPAISSRIFSMDFCTNANFETQQAARRLWWDQIGRPVHDAFAAAVDRDRDPDRRLVIGYVSADFKHHSAAFSFAPVISSHDRQRFEVICYSGVALPDAMTAHFQAKADKWRDMSQWSDDQLAESIKADRVDILVDLSGHTAGNRLRLFARKVAPVQVTAWGHSTGTGMPTVDYLFADPITIPKEVRHLFAEAIYDLPSNMIIDPPPSDWWSSEVPSETNGYLTYGVLNRVSKMSDPAILLWSRIMVGNPTARLILKDSSIDDPAVRHTLLEKFAANGVAAERITLFGSTSREDHLRTLQKIDLCLDPFPQPGGVSSWEALYMGVPVVTKIGNTINSRLGAAILATAGIPEFIGKNDDEYLQIALNPDGERLRSIRQGLRGFIYERFGPAVYTRAVEDAYRAMWQSYCASPPADPSRFRKRGATGSTRK
ncbi:glycosyltransferase family 41 protein [Rhodopseudomonas sp. B29]|uniref:tetratricopeptide repeat protein n=1 Tax=Rhodopseudomonas sp. B29 TaxID=95607 RepID=UPI00034AE2A8|nr:glycosyltransferase family 41 protein [Rhodopseudomonas sp. B29]